MMKIIKSHAAFVNATANAAVDRRSEKVNITDILTSTVYSNGVATIAMIVSFIAVPASGYLSYKFAIKGERRKEWNSIADPIRFMLIKQIDAIKHDGYLLARISRGDILNLCDRGSVSWGKQLIQAFEQFELDHSHESIMVVNNYKPELGDTTKALLASENLLKLIERR